MAAASYTTDLVLINECEVVTNFTEPTGATAGGTAAQENEFFIQNSFSISKTFNATGLGGLHFNNGAGITIPTDGAVFTWIYWTAPNSLATKANGGQRITIGSGVGAYRNYYVAGGDTNTYGGWVNYPVNPTTTPSLTTGTPTTTYQYFGYVVNNNLSISRGNPYGIDVIRYGRGSIIMVNGDLANGYATFPAAAAVNDSNVTGAFNRWGIFSEVQASYKMQGRLQFGSAGTPVDFRDSNRTITIQNTEFVTSNFNLFEILNASSRVDWTAVNVQSLSTVSRGNFKVTNNAIVNLSRCNFSDMGTFEFQSNTSVTNSVFTRCSTITHGSSTFTNNTVNSSVATSAVLTTNPGTIQNCSFVSGGTGHGLEITAPGTYTLSANTFTGYGSAGTTNAAVYNNSGGAVTLNVSGGGTVPTIRNGTNASTTVNASANVTLTGLKADSEVRAYVGTNPATATELSGTESSGTSFNFAQSVGGQAGYIQIFHVEYQPVFLNITYSSSDVSIPIQQIVDRQYSRGTTFTPN